MIFIYSRCMHLVTDQVVCPGAYKEFRQVFDWCPQCTREMIARQNRLQETFDMTFGVIDEAEEN